MFGSCTKKQEHFLIKREKNAELLCYIDPRMVVNGT